MSKAELNSLLKDVIIADGVKLMDRIIILAYRGSITHGTYRPAEHPNSVDDKDIIGVVVMPIEYYLGLTLYKKRTFRREVLEIKEGVYDCVFYDIRKYVRLLLKQNPNVQSLLWLRDQDYIYRHPLAEMLIDFRDKFLSKSAYQSYSGYAMSQLRRMTHQAYQGYMGQKRKMLVEKHGFDTKNAAHLLRLLRMGIELLQTGKLNVYRHDRQQLLEIKDGKWSLERIEKEAEKLFGIIDEVYAKSDLPNDPDYQFADEILIRMILEFNKGM